MVESCALDAYGDRPVDEDDVKVEDMPIARMFESALDFCAAEAVPKLDDVISLSPSPVFVNWVADSGVCCRQCYLETVPVCKTSITNSICNNKNYTNEYRHMADGNSSF